MLSSKCYILLIACSFSLHLLAQDAKKKESKIDRLIREGEELIKETEASIKKTKQKLSRIESKPVKSPIPEKEKSFSWGPDPYSKEVTKRMQPRIKKYKGWRPFGSLYVFSLYSPGANSHDFSPVLAKLHQRYGKDPKILDRPEHEDYEDMFEGLVKKINNTVHKDDFKGFLKLCEPTDNEKDIETYKKMFKRFRDGMLFFPTRAVGFLHNQEFPNLIVVELYSYTGWGSYVKVPGIKDAPLDQKSMTFKEYSDKTGKHFDFYRNTLRFGFRYTLYYRYDEKRERWLLTAKNRDPELEELLKNGPFYAHVRKKIWSGKSPKGKTLSAEEIDNINKPFDYKEHYVKNDHFALEEAIALEKFVHEINKLYKKTEALSDQEYWMYEQLEKSAYAEYDKFSKNKNFNEYFTEEEARKAIKEFNEINYQDREMTYFAGKERLLRYIGKYNVKVFKRPIFIDCKPIRVIDKSRNSELELVAALVSSFYNELHDNGEPSKYKREELKKAGYSTYQLQGYQVITFRGIDLYRFFGVFINTKEPHQKKMYIPRAFNLLLSPKRKVWVYCSVNHLPHEAPLMLLPISMFRAAINYEYLLNTVFDEMPDSEGFFDSEPTGKNYEARLKKLGIHDIMRIRRPEECTPYKEGLDYKKLPCFTLEDIKKSK